MIEALVSAPAPKQSMVAAVVSASSPKSSAFVTMRMGSGEKIIPFGRRQLPVGLIAIVRRAQRTFRRCFDKNRKFSDAQQSSAAKVLAQLLAGDANLNGIRIPPRQRADGQ